MKKLTKKSRIRLFIVADILISITVAAIILLLRIHSLSKNYGIELIRPADELTRAVRKATGKALYYYGKEESDSGVAQYEYQIKKQDKEAVANLLNALNDAIENEQGKIRVSVWAKMSVNGLECVFALQNFSDAGLGEADYDGMQAIWIGEPDMVDEECFYDPSFYTGIEGIRKLSIAPQMQKKAEKEGIDWYEIWPDLEEVEVAGWYED